MSENVTKKMKKPGKKLSHHAISMTSFPSPDNYTPTHLWRGNTTMPKKLSPLSAKIAPLTPNVKLIKKIGVNKGAKYLKNNFKCTYMR